MPSGGLSDRLRRVLGAKASDRRFLVARSLFDLSARVIGVGLVTLWALVLTRPLGAEDYGRYVFVMSAVFVAGMIGGMGVPVAAGFFVQRYRLRAQAFLGRFLIWAAVVSVVGPLVTAFSLWLAADALEARMFAGVSLWVVLALGVGVALVQGAHAMARALEHSTLAAYNEQVWQRAVPFAVVGGVVALGATLTPNLALLAMVVASFACVVPMAWLAGRAARRAGGWLGQGERPTVPEGGRNRRPWRLVGRLGPAWLRRSSVMMVTPLFFLVLSETDVLMLGLFTTPATVGIYNVARRVAGLLRFVQTAVLAVGQHRFAAAYIEKDRARAQSLVEIIALVSLAPALVLWGVLALFGPWILGLFGPEMMAGHLALMILASAAVLDSALGASTELLMMSGQQRIVGIVNGIAGGLNIVLNLILVPSLGLIGAALATTLCLALWKGVLAWVAWRRLGVITPIGLRPLLALVGHRPTAGW